MYLWTSEAVAAGHPDKTADQIADTILDAYLAADPMSRVASEVTIVSDFLLLSGEISSKAFADGCGLNIEPIVRAKLCEIGYDNNEVGVDGKTIKILNVMRGQSPQIAAAVSKEDGQIGAGDQGMMFGFACNETPNFMPLAHALAFEAIRLQESEERLGASGTFMPDAKSQVTIAYDDNDRPMHIDTIVFSACHKAGLTMAQLVEYVKFCIINPMQEAHPELFKPETKLLINPAGLWTLGGPAADTGLTGRKIVVDNYGADCPIGGGSFSGKDPTKVDRSAAYAARWVAKNIVAAGLARRVQVQLAYAIGVAQPVSVRIQAKGVPDRCNSDKILSKLFRLNEPGEINAFFSRMVAETVDLSPRGIIDRLDLRKPIYAATARDGHFGRDGFSWENLDLVPVFMRWAEAE